MLAKEFKIETLKQQREFILDMLTQRLEKAKKTNGDVSYLHEGQIYGEVIKYFEDEGFTITPVSSAEQGRILSLFTIECELNKEEQDIAEQKDYCKAEATNNALEDDMLNLFGSLGAFARNTQDMVDLGGIKFRKFLWLTNRWAEKLFI